MRDESNRAIPLSEEGKRAASRAFEIPDGALHDALREALDNPPRLPVGQRGEWLRDSRTTQGRWV